MYVYEQMEMDATNKDDNSFTSHIGNLMDIDSIVTGVTLVKRPYTQESRQQDPVTLWSI